MVCKKCGEEIADDSKFCPVCGAKIEAPAEEAPVEPAQTETPAEEAPAEAATTEAPAAEAQTETPAETPKAETAEPVPTTVDPSETAKAAGKKVVDALRKVPAKCWGMTAAIILAIIVICNIVSCANNKSPFITTDAKESIIENKMDCLVVTNGKKISFDENISSYDLNYNATKAIVLDTEKTLWVTDTKKATKIADDVVKAEFSFYGDVVVYTVKDGSDYAVYSYTVKSKKSKKIYDEAIYNLVLSTNGQAVAFTNADGDLLVSKKGATAKKEYNEAKPVAITNDGKHIYYTKNDKFYVDDDKLCNSSSPKTYFNIDHTELIFGTSDATYYYALKMKEPNKIKSASCSGIITPANAASIDTISGMKSINGCVVAMEGSLYYVAKKGEKVEKIISSYNYYLMSEDGKSIVYTSGGDIYKVANVTKTTDPKRLAEDVDASYLYTSKDLKTIYFINSDKELRYLKNGKGEMITDDLYYYSYWGYAIYNIEYDDNSKCIVFINGDKELCTAKTSKKSKQKVGTVEAKGIALESRDNATFITITDEDGTYHLYKLTSTKKAKKLISIETSVKPF